MRIATQRAAFERADECNVEFGTVPDCDCPHEHWHVNGDCLDVHVEEDGSGHAIIGNDDCQLEVRGISGLDEMRAIAFTWALHRHGISDTLAVPDNGRLRVAAQAVVDEAARMAMTMRRRRVFDALARSLVQEGQGA